MRALTYFVTGLLFAFLTTVAPAATCTGSDSCTACKNCSSCKYCKAEGNSCGVCASASSSRSSPAGTISSSAVTLNIGTVVGVQDGDTLTVLTPEKQQIRIRVHGIDSPESGQAFGTVAKKHASELVFGKTITFKEQDKDRYGRTVARVILPGGMDFGLAMISAGLAWHYAAYARDEKAYAEAQEKARRRRIGLWRDPQPVAPWMWRRSQSD